MVCASKSSSRQPKIGIGLGSDARRSRSGARLNQSYARFLDSSHSLPDDSTKVETASYAVDRGMRARLRALFASGTVGNERLTATTGAVLLVLLAVEGATLISIRSLLSVHVFVGMLLIPPVVLKLSTTGYRFACYYTRLFSGFHR